MDLSKDLLLFLQFEIQFVVKSNESLAENKIKSETEQLFFKYELGKHVHEHRKQQKE